MPRTRLVVCSPGHFPLPSRVRALSGEVTDVSKAAVLPVAQLLNRRSAGWVWLWSGIASFHQDTKMSPMACFNHYIMKSVTSRHPITPTPPHHPHATPSPPRHPITPTPPHHPNTTPSPPHATPSPPHYFKYL